MNNKRAWLILRDSLVQVEKKSTNYFVKAIPDALKFSKSGSSALLISDDGLLWFNDGSTLVRYDSRHHSNTRENFQAYLSKLIISNSGVVFYNGVNRATTGQVVSSRVRNLV